MSFIQRCPFFESWITIEQNQVTFIERCPLFGGFICTVLAWCYSVTTVVWGLPLSFCVVLICSRVALVAQLVERSPRLQCRGFESHLGQVLVVVVVLFAFDDCFGSRCKHICVVSPQTRLELREKERRMLETTTLCPAWSRWRKTFRPISLSRPAATRTTSMAHPSVPCRRWLSRYVAL